MTKHLLYEEREGSLGGGEDWWYVIADDETGSISVLHEWSQMKPHKGSKGSSGERTYTVADFLSSDGPQPVKAKLETFLAGGGKA